MTAHSPHKKAVIVFIVLAGCLSTLGCQQSSEPAPFFDGFYLKYGETLAKSPKPEDVIWTREIRYIFKKFEDGNFHISQEVHTRRGERLKRELEPIPYPQVGENLTIDKSGIVLKGGDGMNFVDGYLFCLWLPPDKRKKGADLFKVKIMWRVEEERRWEGWEVWPVRMLTQDDMRYYDVNTGFLVGEEHMGGKWKMNLQDTNLDVLKDALALKYVEGDSTSVLSPKEVVKQYCQLQAEGYGLSSEGWEKIEPLVAWPDEPGWDTVIVISDYKIVKAETVGGKALVMVQYFILGRDSVEFVKSKRVKEITFELGMVDGNWKIAKPQVPPHVNKETIIRHLRKIQSREKARRDQLEAEIQAIIEADK